jgi:hypothetical protein
MNLTEQNYFSLEAERAYMSNHLWNMFTACEAKAMAYLNGQYQQPENENFLVGLFVEACLQNRNMEFCADHSELYAKTGKKELLAKFKHCEKMYQRCKRDSLFMQVLQGESQEIYTGELFGLPWKCKTDSVNHERGVIVDIKTTASFEDDWAFVNEKNQKVAWYEVWNYWRQLAIQRELVHQKTGKEYICLIAGVTKQDPPDIDVIEFSNEKRFQLEMMEISSKTLRIKEVFQGRENPISCGKCDHCREIKVLKKIDTARSIYG